MEVISLSSRRGPKGGYGVYHYIGDGKGVKVLKGLFNSKASAKASGQWLKAVEEADLLVQAHDSGVTPECFGVTLIKVGKRWQVGIVMQHLGAIRLADLKMSANKKEAILDRLLDRLVKFGVYNSDLHPWNVMVMYTGTKKKFYAIDFSPDYTWIQ